MSETCQELPSAKSHSITWWRGLDGICSNVIGPDPLPSEVKKRGFAVDALSAVIQFFEIQPQRFTKF